MDPDERRLLATYLNDHLAGATAGCRRFARAAQQHRDAAAQPVLARVHRECEEDRRTLVRLMRSVGVRRRPSLLLAARVAEAVGTLKPNGRVLRQSPLTLVVEVEGLQLGVAGKGALWASLTELNRHDGRFDAATLQELSARTRAQHDALETVRRAAVVDVLGTDPSPARRRL